jgi:broad specificity phosphatase PhoE
MIPLENLKHYGALMNELILVRHGESEYMINGLTGGWTDTPLTESRRIQAEATGKRLLDVMKEPHSFYSSDLRRAAETAHIIGTLLGRDPVLTADLREHNNGKAAHKSKEEAKLMRQPETEPILDWVPYPGATMCSASFHLLFSEKNSIQIHESKKIMLTNRAPYFLRFFNH